MAKALALSMGRGEWRRPALVAVAAVAIAAASARPYAGGWNDGAWLAAVEALVDHGTLAIDTSIYVDPSRADPAAPTPYPRHRLQLMTRGTLDKLYIDGHYYSSRPPVPALLLAGGYAVLQQMTGLVAREHPDRFAYVMTLLFVGLPWIVAMVCTDCLVRRILPSPLLALGITASFALATTALSYTRHVNSHLLLMGIAAALMLGLHQLRPAEPDGPRAVALPAVLGSLAGLGYTVDLGVGPVLVLTLTPLVVHRVRGARSRPRLAAYLLAAVPWIALHHAVNYSIGGTLIPASAVPAYSRWPGSPFDEANLTGRFVHHDPAHVLGYALGLLVGPRGFLLHNPMLLLAAAGGVALCLRPDLEERSELLFAAAWSVGTWLLYALGSVNYGGASASIRWFLPLLVPGFFVLSVMLREAPWRAAEFGVLSVGGLVFSIQLWRNGPWLLRGLAGFWPTVSLTLLAWLACWAWRHRADRRNIHS